MTILCPQCSTRNPEGATQCRRCGAALSVMPSTSTRRGSPTASLLGERWVLDGPLHGSSDPYLFLGHHIDTAQLVVIKRLPEQAARDRAMRARFFHEARILSQLNHMNLARVIDVIDSQTEPAMILEHFDGETLETLLSRVKRLPVGVALEFAGQILDGLQDMHEQGIIHRQLTPRSIQVRHQQGSGVPLVVLSDFGVAQVMPSVAGGSSSTLLGMRAADVLSTVEATPYSAPEALTLDSQIGTDLYAFGVILFQMLSGSLPIGYDAKSREELGAQIHQQSARSIRQLCPSLSYPLDALLQSLLHKRAMSRPQDANELIDILRQLPEQRHEQMVYVPAGPFTQGSPQEDEQGRREERPAREVELSGFFIDRTPVTCAQFKTFIDVTRRQMPQDWSVFNDPTHYPQRPVVFVNWLDAQDYARWANKRLPTEAEWEKAARGPQGYTYPWGEELPNEDRAWYNGQRAPLDVGQRPRGGSIYNVQDMAGNVFEWVADWYDRHYYQLAPTQDPQGPLQGKKRVLKGGSFVHPDFALRCAVRGRYSPEERRANHSFRCAWSLHG